MADCNRYNWKWKEIKRSQKVSDHLASHYIDGNTFKLLETPEQTLKQIWYKYQTVKLRVMDNQQPSKRRFRDLMFVGELIP
jgi:hypothetical protein